MTLRLNDEVFGQQTITVYPGRDAYDDPVVFEGVPEEGTFDGQVECIGL